MDRGTLVLVVGPSGVGKDSLIAYARARLQADGGFVFPQRAITRAGADTAEDHLSLSEDDFAAAVAGNAFGLHWLAHGLAYGVPAAIGDELANGRHVVVNVSRAVIDDARHRFSPVKVVSVTAPAVLLAERLGRRGRESGEGIGRRLDRAASYEVAGPDVVALDNAGPIEEAGERFLAFLRAL
jgi:phosphonate metabolism protein PhnN/1,5-bisphosphokinase (PRPP-forming)